MTTGLLIDHYGKSFSFASRLMPPRERALALLEQIRTQISAMNPYRFSIRVSDILRRYVTEQFGLPVTRQTSVEFLNGLRSSSQFSEDENHRHLRRGHPQEYAPGGKYPGRSAHFGQAI